MLKFYNYRDGAFSIRSGFLGWQWQKTGARGWSKIYKYREHAQDAIDADFPCEPIQSEGLAG